MRLVISRTLIVIALLVGTGACHSNAVIVTGQADGAPIGCSPQEVAQRLADLFDAINRGDPNVAPEFFGRQDGGYFQWYSMGAGETNGQALHHFVTRDLNELAAYFAKRHAHGEHLQLQRLKVNGWENGRGLVHFGPVEFTRTADDLNPAMNSGFGKGAYHCGGHVFEVLSLGTTTGSDTP